MKRTLPFLIVLTIVPAASMAASKIPLKEGVYIDSSQPCENAPRAFLTGYYDGAFNGARAEEIVTKNGKTQAKVSEGTLTVISPTEFSFVSDHTNSRSRWCFPSASEWVESMK